ncbi:MAG: hypothetical protein K0R34_1979, partial [Herbinix sp.]|nr:hypothetical protein [Herbinix sp.]
MISTATSAGFCFGVKRAVDLVYKAIESGEKVYTYGPIIHNEEVVADLCKKGVTVIEAPEELKTLPAGTIIIRSHGVSETLQKELSSHGHKLIDATCPYVKKIHKVVRDKSEQGQHIIIVGNRTHPEVEGIIGWCKTAFSLTDSTDYTVIESEEEAEKFDVSKEQKVSIVAQTTFNYKKFQDLVEIILKKGYDIFVLNTIC